MDIINLIFRWIHVGAVIIAIGGAFFMRMVVLPALADLDETRRQDIRARLVGRWSKFVHMCVGLLVISGFYNYLVVMRPQHSGQGTYHMLVGIKIAIAFVVFFLAEALVGRSAGTAPIRAAAGKWLGVLLILALLIVGISGYLKFMPTVAVAAGS
jgi:uncharacterized membrane protein